MIPAKTIVERVLAKKLGDGDYPSEGRYHFERSELIRVIRAVQKDAATEANARGGRATSKAKATAARANGAKGGRPRKGFPLPL